MDQHILTVMNKLLAYNDSVGVTNNPKQRAFDFTRSLSNISISKPLSEYKVVPAGSQYTAFDGTKASGLVAGSSVVSIKLESGSDSMYSLNVTSGPYGFRTARSVSGISGCNVAVNNGALATFDFTGATLTSVQVGDIMRISGETGYDTGPFAFSPLNSGVWVVLGVQGTVVSASRLPGESFSGVVEAVPAAAPSDVSFYSQSGVQKGDKFFVSALFSTVSRRAYQVFDAKPDRLLFTSSQPLPEESGLTYTSGAVTVYDSIKRLVYIEVDQDAEVRFNGDIGSSVLVSPIEAGNKDLIGFLHKFGPTWKCEIVNRSVNPMNVAIMSGE